MLIQKISEDPFNLLIPIWIISHMFKSLELECFHSWWNCPIPWPLQLPAALLLQEKMRQAPQLPLTLIMTDLQPNMFLGQLELSCQREALIVNAQTSGRVDFLGLLTAYDVYQLNKASINDPSLFIFFFLNFTEYSWFTMLLVSAVQQSDSVIHTLNHTLLNKRIYTYIFFFIYNSLGYLVGACCLSILCT